MMGRPLPEETLRRMRTLLFNHELSPPLVAKRLGLSERVVQVYRQTWTEELKKAASTIAIFQL
jgi:hypothetical protein